MTAEPVEILLKRWRKDLESWAIPGEITAQVSESPWVLPARVFARRAERQLRQPFGKSYEIALEVLQPPGDVLDVGAGAGAACLPLAPRATRITAVDVSEELLSLFAATAARLHTSVETVCGRWPEAAGRAGAADLVTCHHVLYNVADLEPFVAALTRHARRGVVAEVTARHPLAALNPLWERFHGLRRPDRPTADDLLAVLAGLGLEPSSATWTRPPTAEYETFAEMVDVTRRRLCLPPGRHDEVAAALCELGADPDRPPDFGSSGRDLVTIWWQGTAHET
jgi:SAM-dependent methyltransferase